MPSRRIYQQSVQWRFGGRSSCPPDHVTPKESDQRIGIISNTVRNEMAQGYRQTYQALAEIGYRFVELPCEPEGIGSQELSQFMKTIGLRSISVSVSMGGVKKGLRRLMILARSTSFVIIPGCRRLITSPEQKYS